MFAEITVAAVGKKQDDIAACAALNELLHGTERRARGRTGNNTFMLCKSARAFERLRVADLDKGLLKGTVHNK